MSKTRKYTDKVMQMMDDGALSPRAVADVCLGYMSEADVEDMATSEGWIEEEEGSE